MKRFRLIAGLAATTLCLFAATGYAQNTSTPGTTDPNATGSVSAPQGGTDATAQTAAPTTGTSVTGESRTTDATTTTTTTETTSFPGGVLGILAVAVLVLLVLFALFRGRDRDRTVVRETSTSASTTGPATTRTTSTYDDRNLAPRAASGPGNTSGGVNDPNARR
jgi:hypothetical protein